MERLADIGQITRNRWKTIDGHIRLHLVPFMGKDQVKLIGDEKWTEYPSSFSPDRKRLAFNQNGNGGSFDIFTMPVEVDLGRGALGVRLGKAELFLGTPFIEVNPAFSPDGRFLAYVSTVSSFG